MKFFLTFLVLAFVSGCTGEVPTPDNAKANIICMQGVKYYKFHAARGNAGYGFMAPVFNRRTKQIETCE